MVSVHGRLVIIFQARGQQSILEGASSKKAVSVHMRADASRGQKRALYSLALEFQAVVNLLMASGKQKDRRQQYLRQGHTSDGPASSYHTPEFRLSPRSTPGAAEPLTHATLSGGFVPLVATAPTLPFQLCQLGTNLATRKEETSTEELPSSDRPVGMSMGHFPDMLSPLWASPSLGLGESGLYKKACQNFQNKLLF